MTGTPDVAQNPSGPFRTLSELETLASRRIPDALWAYLQGGAGEERTVAANHDAFRRWTLRPKVLMDVTSIDLRTRILGAPVAGPFFVAPMAYHAQFHPDGELATARACAQMGTLGVFGTLSSCSLEEIASAGGPRWFQVYLQPDFRVTSRLVERAERAGYSAIVPTLDVPVLGVRDRQALGGFAIDSTVPIGNGPEVVTPARSLRREGELYRLGPEAGSTWEVLEELASITRLPIVPKGVLTAADARLAVRHGAKALVVSNHGGRQLDGAPASLDALPEVVAEVGSEVEVYVDGGARRGPDVLIALALGARGVGIGRPVLWALSVAGAEGVHRYLELLAQELATSMALAGRRSIGEVDRSLIARPRDRADPTRPR